MDELDRSRLEALARQLRVDSVAMADTAGSGHPTSSMSAADLLAVLVARHLRLDFAEPKNPANDHLVFSKGHASPLLYAVFRAVGAVDDEELLTYRRLGSRLEGHPTPRLPWVDVATGSLGQGLPIGVGIALALSRLESSPARVWVLCGDSELAEGSIWEAFEHASFNRLDRLTAVVDVNRLGQRGETMVGWNTEVDAARARAFGWEAIEIDGHDLEEIDRAFTAARETTGKPTVVLARTKKGRGVAAVEDKEGMHGKPLPDAEAAIEELGGRSSITVAVQKPDGGGERRGTPAAGDRRVEPPRYEQGARVATRKAYGEALVALGAAYDDVVVLDGEVSNSTFADLFAAEFPERYFEVYIAEQQLVAAAVGMQVRGFRPFASTFAAFLSRAYDFVRMAAVSRASIALSGSHAGVSIGEDGPSQMALEDIASLRAITGTTVLYPCDGNQTARLVEAMHALPGISYLRTTRGETPVLYGPDETFVPGGSRIVRDRARPDVTIVAAGITVHESLAAAERLAGDGVEARVIDAYSVKPIDAATLRDAAAASGLIVTVEDHRPEGGLGDAVLDALAAGPARPPVLKLGVRELPGSGTPEELLAGAGIDAAAIERAVREGLSRRGAESAELSLLPGLSD